MVIVVNCGSTKTPEIANCIGEQGLSTQIINLNEFGPNDLNEAQALVLSGAPILLSQIDPTQYLERFEFIKSINLPTLGICFGHQIIGMLFGAKVALGIEDRAEQVIWRHKEHWLFEGLPNPVRMMQDHCEYLELPEGFRLIASSEVTQNEAMVHETQPLVGVQFHPEVSGEYGKTLFTNFCKYALDYHR